MMIMCLKVESKYVIRMKVNLAIKKNIYIYKNSFEMNLFERQNIFILVIFCCCVVFWLIQLVSQKAFLFNSVEIFIAWSVDCN